MKLIPAQRDVQAELDRPPASALGRGAEHAGVIIFFFGIGWLLDRTLDTKPWFMIGMVVFAMVGQFARLYYAYDADMKQHEARLSARRNGGSK